VPRSVLRGSFRTRSAARHANVMGRARRLK
jgi:hypothetical protein